MEQDGLPEKARKFVFEIISQLSDTAPPWQKILAEHDSVMQNCRDEWDGKEEGYIEELMVIVGSLVISKANKIELISRYFAEGSLLLIVEFEQDLEHLQGVAKQHSSNTLQETRKIYEKHLSNKEKIDQLEFDYYYYKSYNDLLLNLIRALIKNSSHNKDALDEMLTLDVKAIGKLIEMGFCFTINAYLGRRFWDDSNRSESFYAVG